MADKTPPESEHPGYAVEGNDLDGYVGVSPEYKTYADETSKPFVTDEERELFDNAKRAEEDAVVEINAYGLPVGAEGDAFDKAETQSRAEQLEEANKASKSKSTAKSDDDTASKPAAARTTTAAKPAASK